jgi:hypothetical protein
LQNGTTPWLTNFIFHLPEISADVFELFEPTRVIISKLRYDVRTFQFSISATGFISRLLFVSAMVLGVEWLFFNLRVFIKE